MNENVVKELEREDIITGKLGYGTPTWMTMSSDTTKKLLVFLRRPKPSNTLCFPQHRCPISSLFISHFPLIFLIYIYNIQAKILGVKC